MAQSKCLGSGCQKPHYLEMSSLRNYQDLELVSQNGEMISSNKVVFAGLCHKIVCNSLTEEESKLVIVTEHTKDQLNKIVNYIISVLKLNNIVNYAISDTEIKQHCELHHL